jgi:hypothetical protein
MANIGETPATPDLDELDAALRIWNDAATRYLANCPQSEIFVYSVNSWNYSGEDIYAQSPVILRLGQETIDHLMQLPSYAALEKAAMASPHTAPLLGQMVGTVKSRTRFTIWTLAKAFLPDQENLMYRERPFEFEEKYSGFMRQLNDGYVTYQTVFPMQGISFANDHIELADDIFIDRLTTDDIKKALEVGLLPQGFPGGQFHAEPDKSFALKKVTYLPLLITSEQDLISGLDQEVMKYLIQMQSFDEMAELQQCLALLTGSRIQFSGQLVDAKDDGFLGIGAGTMSAAISISWHGPSVHFSNEQCAELRQLWRLYHFESFQQNRALGLALRRLAFATQRNSLEDRLLDVFIAAEALYLADAGDAKERGDLRFRLALRAALWSDGTLMDWNRQQVFRQMRCGYDVRSAVAHGGQPKSRDTKVKDVMATLPELVKATEDIVRAGLYKAVRSVPAEGGKRFSIPWDDLTLP